MLKSKRNRRTKLVSVVTLIFVLTTLMQSFALASSVAPPYNPYYDSYQYGYYPASGVIIGDDEKVGGRFLGIHEENVRLEWRRASAPVDRYPYREIEYLYVDGVKTYIWRYTGNVANVKYEWKYDFWELKAPHKIVERLYVNGNKTNILRYNGKTEDVEIAWLPQELDIVSFNLAYDEYCDLITSNLHHFYAGERDLNYIITQIFKNVRVLDSFNIRRKGDAEWIQTSWQYVYDPNFADQTPIYEFRGRFAEVIWTLDGWEMEEPYRFYELLSFGIGDFVAASPRTVVRYTGKFHTPVVEWREGFYQFEIDDVPELRRGNVTYHRRYAIKYVDGIKAYHWFGDWTKPCQGFVKSDIPVTRYTDSLAKVERRINHRDVWPHQEYYEYYVDGVKLGDNAAISSLARDKWQDVYTYVIPQLINNFMESKTGLRVYVESGNDFFTLDESTEKFVVDMLTINAMDSDVAATVLAEIANIQVPDAYGAPGATTNLIHPTEYEKIRSWLVAGNGNLRQVLEANEATNFEAHLENFIIPNAIAARVLEIEKLSNMQDDTVPAWWFGTSIQNNAAPIIVDGDTAPVLSLVVFTEEGKALKLLSFTTTFVQNASGLYDVQFTLLNPDGTPLNTPYSWGW